MRTFMKRIRWGLAAFTLLAGASFADGRDSAADLITISARVVAMYSSTSHKAGDPDGQFIEDIVIPAVHEVVASDRAQLTKAQHLAALDFIIASNSLASEEIADIAATLYVKQKTRLCSSIAGFSDSRKKIVLNQVRSGLAAVGKPVPRIICK